MITAKGASRTFVMGATEVHALRGVDLAIEDGEFVAIMGPSGSGKSTLMYLIGALDQPSAGSILHGDQDVADCDSNGLAELRGKRVGFVFQMFSLMPTLSALDNVELPMMFQGVERGRRRARARELLELVGMTKRMNHLPSELSGGEQQRVAIARALANDPDLILADEPTGNLDSKTGEQIIDLLKSLNRSRGTTIVLVTHDMALASHAERIIRLWDGCVFAGGKHVKGSAPEALPVDGEEREAVIDVRSAEANGGEHVAEGTTSVPSAGGNTEGVEKAGDRR